MRGALNANFIRFSNGLKADKVKSTVNASVCLYMWNEQIVQYTQSSTHIMLALVWNTPKRYLPLLTHKCMEKKQYQVHNSTDCIIEMKLV